MRTLAMSLAAGVALGAPASAGSHRVARWRCPKLFSVKMGERAGRAVYHGTRDVARRDLRLLGRVEMCTRNPRAQWFVRWYDHHQRSLWLTRRQARAYTGYVVEGGVSTFGPPTEGGSTTADGGDDSRPCIALKDTSTLGRTFLVTIDGHRANLLHCDSGPYSGDRQIDVSGAGAYDLGLDPYNFPTDSYGTARELR